jgi:cyclic pyranopterin phosphate synthase
MNEAENDLTHVDAQGHAHMVDVGEKAHTPRIAVARGEVHMNPATLQRLVSGAMPKGDVLAVARVAGIMAAKRTPELIPLCHTLLLTKVTVEMQAAPEGDRLLIETEVRTHGQTGVEMEALTALSVAALTIYDMCKAVDKTMRISEIRLARKSGGKSGDTRYEA